MPQSLKVFFFFIHQINQEYKHDQQYKNSIGFINYANQMISSIGSSHSKMRFKKILKIITPRNYVHVYILTHCESLGFSSSSPSYLYTIYGCCAQLEGL